jgi:hypothetical protein
MTKKRLTVIFMKYIHTVLLKQLCSSNMSPTLSQRAATVWTHSICKQQKVKCPHKNCSSCTTSVDELFPSGPSQFPKHPALDRIPEKISGIPQNRYSKSPQKSQWIKWECVLLYYFTPSKARRFHSSRLPLRGCLHDSSLPGWPA